MKVWCIVNLVMLHDGHGNDPDTTMNVARLDKSFGPTMIYFNKKTQATLVDRFYSCLRDGGWLFVGHSESLTGLAHPFKYIEPSIYRK